MSDECELVRLWRIMDAMDRERSHAHFKYWECYAHASAEDKAALLKHIEAKRIEREEKQIGVKGT